MNVLEHTGNIQLFTFAWSPGAGVLIEGPAAQGWQYLHNSQGWIWWMPKQLHQRRGSHACGHRPAVHVLRQSLWGSCLGGLRPIFFWQLVTQRYVGEERLPHFLFRCSCLLQERFLYFRPTLQNRKGRNGHEALERQKCPHDTTEHCTSGE